MEWTIGTFLLANFILITASILQMATGVSIGMIIVPFLAMISYTLVPVPVVFASLVLTVMMSYQGREHIDMKNIPSVSIAMMFGILLAAYVMSSIKFDYLGIVFGLLILVSVFISIKIKTFQLNPALNYSAGFMAGFMGAMAAVGGQIIALLFQNHPLASIKATLAALYTIFNITMLIIFYFAGQFSFEQLISGFYMMPGFLIGVLVAPMFTKYFNPKYAKPVVLGMATFGAVILIIKGVLA
jgi:uncharacterized membrane protein YfcA